MSVTAPESQGSPSEGYPLYAYAVQFVPDLAGTRFFLTEGGAMGLIPLIHRTRDEAEVFSGIHGKYHPKAGLKVVRFRLEQDPEPAAVAQGEEVDR